jgi:hypothetical protein
VAIDRMTVAEFRKALQEFRTSYGESWGYVTAITSKDDDFRFTVNVIRMPCPFGGSDV